jgi:hypothetical protein
MLPPFSTLKMDQMDPADFSETLVNYYVISQETEIFTLIYFLLAKMKSYLSLIISANSTIYFLILQVQLAFL